MNDADKCINCGSCMRACPIVDAFGESLFPGPRSLAVDSQRSGCASSNDELLRCSMCMKCKDACPSRIDLPQILLALRAINFNGPMRQGHMRMLESIDQNGTSVRPDHKVLVPSFPKEADTCLFPGCIARWRRPEVVEDVWHVLRSNGIPVECPDDLVCCGSPLEKIGDHERREKLIARNSSILEKYDRIITTCPGCADQMVGRYGLDAMHIVEYMYEVIGPEQVTKGLDGKGLKAAVHMPCHLSRNIGPHTRDYIHSLLGSVPGLTVVDYPEEDECCGAGGSLLSGFPEMASALAKRKISAASGAGVDIVITSCPFCIVNLNTAGGIETVDISTLFRRLSPR